MQKVWFQGLKGTRLHEGVETDLEETKTIKK